MQIRACTLNRSNMVHRPVALGEDKKNKQRIRSINVTSLMINKLDFGRVCVGETVYNIKDRQDRFPTLQVGPQVSSLSLLGCHLRGHNPMACPAHRNKINISISYVIPQ